MTHQVKYKIYTDNKLEEFSKVYTFLFTERQYGHLKLKVKYLYSILANQLTKDVRNGYAIKDANGRYVLRITRKAIASLLESSEATAKSHINQLIEAGLIKEEVTSGNQPNKITFESDLEFTNAASTYNNNKYTFYRMPKFLEHDYYSKLSITDRLVYTIIRNQYRISIANIESTTKYIDEHGKVFTCIQNNTLIQLLNISEPTLIKAKKKLIALGLIRQAELSVKESCKTYVRYYVYEPIALPVKNMKRKVKTTKYKLTAITPKYTRRVLFFKPNTSKILVGTPQKFKSINTININTKYSNTINNDMYDMYDEKGETNNYQFKHNTFNQQDDEDSFKYNDQQRNLYFDAFPEQIVLALKPYNFEDARAFMSIMCKTKNEINKYNQDSDQRSDLTLEEMELELANTIHRVTRTMKTKNETPRQMSGYFKTAVIDTIWEYLITLEAAYGEELCKLILEDRSEFAEEQLELVKRSKDVYMRAYKSMRHKTYSA
ncbi:TPA: replication initiator protein A [Staphylococcus aureus]|nr:replication initiator protein A [Staphylococcus aureus]